MMIIFAAVWLRQRDDLLLRRQLALKDEGQRITA